MSETGQPIDAAAEFHERTSISADGWVPAEDLPPQIPPEPAGPSLPLPLVGMSAAPSLEQTIFYRRTSRSFDPAAVLPLEMLSRFLAFSCGRTAPMGHPAGIGGHSHRATPSAGGSYAVEARVAALRVAAVAPGIYAYDVQQHALRLARCGFFGDTIARWALNQPWMSGAGVVFALVADASRTQQRYGDRGWRYVLFEAGHVAQNLYLLGAAYGVCVQATGGFFDKPIARLFGVDGTGRRVLYLVAAGMPSPQRGLAPW
jgi:SagB-type dehydrogenase family enzyme